MRSSTSAEGAPPLPELGIPRGKDVGALGYFVAPQTGRAAARRGKAERRVVGLLAAMLEGLTEPVPIGDRHIQAGIFYTGIRSLLYPDTGGQQTDSHPPPRECDSCVYS